MKNHTLFLSLLLAAALFAGIALAAGGDADDPLISLDYLKNTFAAGAGKAVDEKLDAADKAVYDAAEAQWRAAVASAEAAAGAERASAWTETRLKQGDILSGLTGAQVLLLAGDASVTFSSGAVVDVTDGTELASGDALRRGHRYMAAEDTTALFTVSSRTAVVDYCGDYHITASASAPDYNAMASALKALTLLRGTDTGYGEGFDLEKTPTRIEALVMLVRMLGEEGDALASAAPQPFSDVPDWAARYVAYAYEKGYSNGVGDGKFGSMRSVTAMEYVEFVLRALGYSSTERSDISDALARALSSGVITAGEKALLESAQFLRADVAYLSWYALEAPLSGEALTLREKLESGGAFTSAAYQDAKALVVSARL